MFSLPSGALGGCLLPARISITLVLTFTSFLFFSDKSFNLKN